MSEVIKRGSNDGSDTCRQILKPYVVLSFLIMTLLACTNKVGQIDAEVGAKMDHLSKVIYDHNDRKEFTNNIDNKQKKSSKSSEVSTSLNSDEKLQKSTLGSDQRDWNSTSIAQGKPVYCFKNQKYNRDIDNELKITMGGYGDLYVKLINRLSDKVIREAFIKRNTTYSIRNIPEGVYYIKTAFGKGLKTNNNCDIKFENDAYYKKGENQLDFYIKENYDGYSIPSFHLSLDVEVSFTTGSQYDSESITLNDFNN